MLSFLYQQKLMMMHFADDLFALYISFLPWKPRGQNFFSLLRIIVALIVYWRSLELKHNF